MPGFGERSRASRVFRGRGARAARQPGRCQVPVSPESGRAARAVSTAQCRSSRMNSPDSPSTRTAANLLHLAGRRTRRQTPGRSPSATVDMRTPPRPGRMHDETVSSSTATTIGRKAGLCSRCCPQSRSVACGGPGPVRTAPVSARARPARSVRSSREIGGRRDCEFGKLAVLAGLPALAHCRRACLGRAGNRSVDAYLVVGGREIAGRDECGRARGAGGDGAGRRQPEPQCPAGDRPHAAPAHDRHARHGGRRCAAARAGTPPRLSGSPALGREPAAVAGAAPGLLRCRLRRSHSGRLVLRPRRVGGTQVAKSGDGS